VTLTFPIPWLLGRSLPPEDQRRARLLRVLRSAVAKTRYAREYDQSVDRFEQVPKVELLNFLCHPERYAVANAIPVRKRLHYPLGEAPRTAVVAREVDETRRVRCFPKLSAEGLRAFAPQSLAAPLDTLRAAGVETPGHGPLRNAVIVFTGILEGPLMTEDADSFWRRYQVPVFEQFLGLDGELLAWECEMHHGLHVREEAAYFESGDQDRLAVSFLANPRLPLLRLETGLTGRLIAEPCPCGDESPRLVDLRRRSMRPMGRAGMMAAAAVS
jgi:hypothetical protein